MLIMIVKNSDNLKIVKGYGFKQKDGDTMLGICPFHKEETPSCYYNFSKDSFYCFGCGAAGHGDALIARLSRQSQTKEANDG